jgi:Ca2+-binding EF-hand superfamily protein
MTMNALKTLLAGLAVAGAMSAVPVMAQEATPWQEAWMKMMDKNKDGMVSKQEFLDAMAKMWDEKHAKMMKAEKDMKAGMMTKAQFMHFTKDLTDPGQVGGN